MTWHRYALLVAPIAALGLGVWAEFADLNAPALFAVALPAIIVSTLSAAALARRLPRPFALLLSGVVVGTLTFALTEGTYLSIHFSRGGEVNFEGLGSQRTMALALLGIHVMVGAAIGAAVGAGLAAVSLAGRLIEARTAPSPPAPLPQRGRGVTGRSG